MNHHPTTRTIRRAVLGALLVGTLGALAAPALAANPTSATPVTPVALQTLASAASEAYAITSSNVSAQAAATPAVSPIPAKPYVSTTTSAPPKTTNKTTLKQAPPVKNTTRVKPSYTGPRVVAGLPFTRVAPSGSARELAQAFARDATDLLNCHYGRFDKCAKAVWGRRDPWKMPLEGKSAAFNAPWVALWEKYEQAGVVVWQSNGPYTDRYPQGVPMLDLFYRLTIDGQTFELWMRDDPGHSLTNPSSWYVPGCAVCHAYVVQ